MSVDAFPPEAKLEIVAALVRSAESGDGVPAYTAVQRELKATGRFGRLPSRPTLRKWWHQHKTATADPNRRRAREADAKHDRELGELIEFTGTTSPSSSAAAPPGRTRRPSMGGPEIPDLAGMSRGEFYRYMATETIEAAALAKSNALTLSSYPGVAKLAGHFFEQMLAFAAGEGPEDLTADQFEAALEQQWTVAPDNVLETVIRIYAERHNVRVMATHDGATTRELGADGWVGGPKLATEASG